MTHCRGRIVTTKAAKGLDRRGHPVTPEPATRGRQTTAEHKQDDEHGRVDRRDGDEEPVEWRHNQ